MSIIQTIRSWAKETKASIVLPESEDERTLRAADEILREDLLKPILIGNPDKVFAHAASLGLSLSPTKIRVIDIEQSEKKFDYANEFFTMRKAKGLTFEDAKKAIDNRLFFGAMMVHRGEADGCVAGAVSTTADVMRAGIQVIGVNKASVDVVSSCFLMVLKTGKAITFADGAVLPYPTAEELADIAIASADTHRMLTGEEPIVAMLSFSTKGSAKHEAVDKVIKATQLAQAKRPDLTLDGELQFDAALIESIGKRKAPNSTVAGKANVFIFPNLDAGNIGYKITERLAGAEAIGPIVQGLFKPMNDLSRGAKAEDIVNVACICAIKAKR